MCRELTKVVDGMLLPESVANALHYYLLYGIPKEEWLEVMEREGVLFLLRYMLSKHFGKVAEFAFVLRVDRRGISLHLKRVVAVDGERVVDGEAVLNPASRVIHLEVAVVEERPAAVLCRSWIEEGVVVEGTVDDEVVAKFCF